MASKQAYLGCQPAQPPGTTVGALAPRRWNRRHHRRQPGARPLSRTYRCALVRASPALALAGSFELLATLIRAERRATAERPPDLPKSQSAPVVAGPRTPHSPIEAPTIEQAVRAWHHAGRSQRSIAQELKIDRRRVNGSWQRGLVRGKHADGRPRSSSPRAGPSQHGPHL